MTFKAFYKQINESFVQDFNNNKRVVLQLIQRYRDGNEAERDSTVLTPLYNIIVNGQSTDASQTIAVFGKTFVDGWKTYLSTSPWVSDGGPWAQINIGEGYTRKQTKVNYNYYISVDKDKANVVRFLKSLYKLATAINDLCNKLHAPIAFKTHRYLATFISHNDSLKVYYRDPSQRNDVQAVIQKWLADNNIQTVTRTHNHGVDLKSDGASDGISKSYGELIAIGLAKSLYDVMKRTNMKHTDDQYFEWFKKYAPDIIKNIKVAGY